MRVVRNLEERNVGTKGKSLKHGLINAKDLTIELPEDKSSYIRGTFYAQMFIYTYEIDYIISLYHTERMLGILVAR